MKIKTTMKVGKQELSLEIEERGEMETLHKAAVLSNPRRKCNVCGNIEQGRFKLDSNMDKEGNVYVNVVCGGKDEASGKFCGAKSKLGQYKAGGYFWREFEQYIPHGGQQQTTSAPVTTGATVEDDSETPF